MAVYFLIALSFLTFGCALSMMSGKWFSKSADAQASGVAAGILFMISPVPMMFAISIAFGVLGK